MEKKTKRATASEPPTEDLAYIQMHGFSVCAGYLAAILEQLSSTKPLNASQKEVAYTEGKIRFAMEYLENPDADELIENLKLLSEVLGKRGSRQE